MEEQIAENMYLTFGLEDGKFAFPVARVREVLEKTTFVRIPRMPEYMKGVLNIRGNALPVADLKKKLGMDFVEISLDAAVIVAEIAREEGAMSIGCLVDSVDEVIDMSPDVIDPPPSMGAGINSDFIEGIGKMNDEFIVILNIDRVFASDELLQFGSAVSELKETVGADGESGIE